MGAMTMLIMTVCGTNIQIVMKLGKSRQFVTLALHNSGIEHECLRGDQWVTVKDKITGDIKDIKIEELYKEINEYK